MPRLPPDLMTEDRMKAVLASNLDRMIRRRNITQSELAAKAGIGKQTINSYFTRKSLPGPVKLDAMAQALGVRAEDLLPSNAGDLPAAFGRGQAPAGDPGIGAPTHVLTALPGRVGFSRLELRADLPTALAVQIMQMLPSEIG